MFILYSKTPFLLSRWDTGKVRDMFGGLCRFKGGLSCKEWVNSVIIIVIREINYRCNYRPIFFKYKYNVKTCMYNICTVPNYLFKCKYIVVKAT